MNAVLSDQIIFISLLLRRFPLLGPGVSISQLENLAKKSKRFQVERNEIIIRQGELAEYIFFTQRGRYSLIKKNLLDYDDVNEYVILAELGGGEEFGTFQTILNNEKTLNPEKFHNVIDESNDVVMDYSVQCLEGGVIYTVACTDFYPFLAAKSSNLQLIRAQLQEQSDYHISRYEEIVALQRSYYTSQQDTYISAENIENYQRNLLIARNLHRAYDGGLPHKLKKKHQHPLKELQLQAVIKYQRQRAAAAERARMTEERHGTLAAQQLQFRRKNYVVNKHFVPIAGGASTEASGGVAVDLVETQIEKISYLASSSTAFHATLPISTLEAELSATLAKIIAKYYVPTAAQGASQQSIAAYLLPMFSSSRYLSDLNASKPLTINSKESISVHRKNPWHLERNEGNPPLSSTLNTPSSSPSLTRDISSGSCELSPHYSTPKAVSRESAVQLQSKRATLSTPLHNIMQQFKAQSNEQRNIDNSDNSGINSPLISSPHIDSPAASCHNSPDPVKTHTITSQFLPLLSTSHSSQSSYSDISRAILTANNQPAYSTNTQINQFPAELHSIAPSLGHVLHNLAPAEQYSITKPVAAMDAPHNANITRVSKLLSEMSNFLPGTNLDAAQLSSPNTLALILTALNTQSQHQTLLGSGQRNHNKLINQIKLISSNMNEEQRSSRHKLSATVLGKDRSLPTSVNANNSRLRGYLAQLSADSPSVAARSLRRAPEKERKRDTDCMAIEKEAKHLDIKEHDQAANSDAIEEREKPLPLQPANKVRPARPAKCGEKAPKPRKSFTSANKHKENKVATARRSLDSSSASSSAANPSFIYLNKVPKLIQRSIEPKPTAKQAKALRAGKGKARAHFELIERPLAEERKSSSSESEVEPANILENNPSLDLSAYLDAVAQQIPGSHKPSSAISLKSTSTQWCNGENLKSSNSSSSSCKSSSIDTLRTAALLNERSETVKGPNNSLFDLAVRGEIRPALAQPNKSLHATAAPVNNEWEAAEAEQREESDEDELATLLAQQFEAQLNNPTNAQSIPTTTQQLTENETSAASELHPNSANPRRAAYHRSRNAGSEQYISPPLRNRLSLDLTSVASNLIPEQPMQLLGEEQQAEGAAAEQPEILPEMLPSVAASASVSNKKLINRAYEEVMIAAKTKQTARTWRKIVERKQSKQAGTSQSPQNHDSERQRLQSAVSLKHSLHDQSNQLRSMQPSSSAPSLPSIHPLKPKPTPHSASIFGSKNAIFSTSPALQFDGFDPLLLLIAELYGVSKIAQLQPLAATGDIPFDLFHFLYSNAPRSSDTSRNPPSTSLLHDHCIQSIHERLSLGLHL
jgi:hypothetical protein